MENWFFSKRKSRRPQVQESLREQLEDRILFDGVPDAPLAPEQPVDDPLAPATDVSPMETADLTVETFEAAARTEVVFVDKRVGNYQELVAELLREGGKEVYFLDRESDGLQQINDTLAGRMDIDAVHLISHGEQGQLRLGSSLLTLDSMQDVYADQLQLLGSHLSDSADILVYGCNFAQGEGGAIAAQLLADLTGADIAASTPAGRMVASMMGAVATSETETMSLRLSEGYRQRAQRGTHVPRQRTFGYSPGNLTADPHEGPIVTEIFARLADGDTIGGIVRDLTERGVVSTKGRPLSRQSLRVIAQNPRYVGVCEYRQVRRDDDGREMRRDLVGTTEGQWEALVDQETFDRVQAILNDPRRRRERPTVKHLLTGIATCGVCGVALRGGQRRDREGQRVMMLQCPNGQHVGRTAAPIEKAIGEIVVARLASNVAAVADGYADSPEVRLDLAALEERRAALASMFADGTLDPEAYAAASKELAARIDEAKAQLVAPTRDPLADVRGLVDADQIRQWWDDADIVARRRVVAALFEISLNPVGKGRALGRSPLAGVTLTPRETTAERRSA